MAALKHFHTLWATYASNLALKSKQDKGIIGRWRLEMMNSGPKKGAATWGLGCFDKGTCIRQGPCSSTVDSSVMARAPLVAVHTILDGHDLSCRRPYVPCTSSNKGPSRYYQKMLRRSPTLWESMLMRGICCTTHVMKFLVAWLVRTSFSFMRLTNMSLEALVHTL